MLNNRHLIIFSNIIIDYILIPSPGIKLDDGVITILVIRNCKRSQLLQLLISIDEGKHMNYPFVEILKVYAYRLEPVVFNHSSQGCNYAYLFLSSFSFFPTFFLLFLFPPTLIFFIMYRWDLQSRRGSYWVRGPSGICITIHP